MIRGVYTAASSLVSNFMRQSIVTNNLANASTTGYKQDLASNSEFTDLLRMENTGAPSGALTPPGTIGTLGTGTELGDILLDMSQGDLMETGNALDLAISGPGFFAVQTSTGTFYTRDGEFLRDASGRLVRPDGGYLLGQNGPIQVGEGEIVVDGDGTVSVNGKAAGRIRLVDFGPQEKLHKVGYNYLAPENPAAQETDAAGGAISQGYLERSNVDLTTATVEMLSALRSYEASQKMIQLQDQTLALAVSEVGKV